MNEQARAILRDLIKARGQEMIQRPELVEGLLLIALSRYPREMNVLLAALHEDLPVELAAGGAHLPEAAIERLVLRLEDCQSLKKEAARWAVESWLQALYPTVGKPSVSKYKKDQFIIKPPKPRVLKSRMAIEVLARLVDRPEDGFRLWGSTPGSVPLPYEYQFIYKKMGLNDTGLEKLGADLGQLDEVYGLSLDSGHFSHGALIAFLSLPCLGGLRRLGLDGTSSTTDAVLEAVARLFPNLEELDPGTRCYITDAGIAHLQALTHLHILNLSHCTKLTNHGVAYLRTLEELESLNLGHNPGIGDEALAHLQVLPRLRQLDLSGLAHISANGMSQLTDLTALADLSLDWNTRTGDDSLDALRPLDGLNRLSLVKCSAVTDAGLPALGDLTSLKDLNLAWMDKITDSGLSALSRLTQLRRLSLYQCSRVTDQGLRHLSNLSELRRLDLAGLEKLTDSGLAHLHRLYNLEDLTLDGKGVSGAGLLALVNHLPDLRRLHVWSAAQVTQAEAAQIRRPGMDVWIRGAH